MAIISVAIAEAKPNYPDQVKPLDFFCYISGSALCSCRDVQRSNSVVDSYGNLRYYSFEACTTPPRNQCTNYGWGSYGGNGGNYGDGDFPYCSNSGSNQGWSSGSSNSNQGWSSGSSNSNYRPGGSSNYRPGGSSSYRPGGSSSSYSPSGSSSYSPSNSPSLSNILNGSIRNGNTGDKNKDKDAVVFSDA